MSQDATDRHVERWRDRQDLGITFDDDVEAIVTRMQKLVRHLRLERQAAVSSVGLQDFEYETLHDLMIRDTPGRASPSALAAGVGISNAGMTGRLDALATAGWVTRTTGIEDRRRVEVEITDAGRDVWARAMALVGRCEDQLVLSLSPVDRDRLSALLRKLALVAEAAPVAMPAAAAAAATTAPETVRDATD